MKSSGWLLLASGLAAVPFPPASLHLLLTSRLLASSLLLARKDNQNCGATLDFSTMNQMHLVCQGIHNGGWPTFWPSWACTTLSETTLTSKLLDFAAHFLVPESGTTPPGSECPLTEAKNTPPSKLSLFLIRNPRPKTVVSSMPENRGDDSRGGS